MKRIWFRRKWYGWGWYPAVWQGWLVIVAYFALAVWIFSQIDRASHSASDTLIGIVAPVLALTGVLVVATWLTGEEPHWQWGKRKVFLEDILRAGGTAVVATDTTYGIVGSAFNEKTVNEIYRLRKRDLDKPFIVLIADKSDLKKFGVKPTVAQEKILHRVWPGSVSVILRCESDKFAYLHRGGKTLAFRVPAKRELRHLLHSVGPLVAPSANPQGHPVARNISEAQAYFGHHVGFYQDEGTIVDSPSKVIDINDGTEKVIRL